MKHRVTLPWTTVFCTSTTPIRIPATAWMPSQDLEKISATMELRNVIGNIQVGLGIEVAQEPGSPSAGTTLLTATTNTGYTYGDFVDVTGDTGGQRLFRFVWLCSNTSGTALSVARVGGYADLQLRG